MAQVGQDAQVSGSVRAPELKRLPGIVWHCKGIDLEAAQVNRRAIPSQSQKSLEIRRPQCSVSAGTHPDRLVVTQCKLPGTTNVVAVLMSDEDCIDLTGIQPGPCQTGIQMLQPETTINQQPGGVQAIGSLNKGRVARTATA